ncbi:MAG: 3-demethylubiquinone-9 3-O-methyltransferase, partial [Pseudomonadota bacterium]
AEDVLRILPKGTHDPDMFIKPQELTAEMTRAGLVPGPMTGLGPRGINGKGDFTFGRLPGRQIIYMGTARKPE